MQRFVSASGIAVFLTGAALAPASGANLAPGPQAIALEEIFFWSLLPIAATLCGIVVAVSRPPGPRVRSALQHLAAGIVVAAVAVEIVPEMLAGGHVLFVASGFTLGVGLMFGVRIAIEALEGPASSAEGGTSAWSMLIATGIDLAIDGLLIGLGFAISVSTGALLTIAVTFEMLFIAIGLSATLRGRGFTARFTVVSLCAMALLTAVCMLLGASLHGQELCFLE